MDSRLRGNDGDGFVTKAELNFGQNTDGNALSTIKKRKSCRFCLNRRRRGAGEMERTLQAVLSVKGTLTRVF